ncbi:MAG: acyl-ACP--UDP-N-acetylglucosamine O-acyltransferase [Planctomycetota bacterium]
MSAETQVHKTAIIAKDAEIGEGAAVGPYCVVHEKTRIGPGAVLHGHVTVFPNVTIGGNAQIWPNVILGGPPQDVKYQGGDTKLIIGEGNVIREGATLHVGSTTGEGVTRVGDDNYLMAYSHVAHDCQVGNSTILSQNVLLAGHVHVEDFAIICGGSALHQFVRVGTGCYIGGLTRIVHDVPPYMIVEGNPSSVRGVNVVGLRRRGVSEETIESLREAYRILWSSEAIRVNAVRLVRETVVSTPEVERLLHFLEQMDQGKHGRYLESSR